MRRAGRLSLAAAAVLLACAPAGAADLFAGYSHLRRDGGDLPGGVLGLSFGGASLRLDVEASGQFGMAEGEDVQEIALLAGPSWRLADGRLRPFLHARAGGVRSRRQVEVFGVAIGRDGVCDGSCPADYGVAAEGGGGLDIRLGGLTLRLPQVDYRWIRVSGEGSSAVRVSAGLLWGRSPARPCLRTGAEHGSGMSARVPGASSRAARPRAPARARERPGGGARP